MSLYEITDLSPGHHLVLRDLLQDVPPVTVIEKAASESLSKWDIIATRVVTTGKKQVISGGLLTFSRKRVDRVMEMLDSVVDETLENMEKLDEFKGVDLTREQVLETILPDAAYVFTTSWLLDMIEHFHKPMPTLVNMEGEALLISEVRFPVKAGKGEALAKRVSGIPGMVSEPGDTLFWNWLEEDDGGRRTSSAEDGVAIGTM
ncbi:MAG: hypothetical protein HQL50_15320, partial [Magnetococcales bacterium]|nr:hypothetical protein [Magnetococcales bacterium]